MQLFRAFLVASLLAAAPLARACPVCFGETDAPIADGLGASILFLIAVTYLLILSGAVMLWRARRRALVARAAEGGDA